MIDHILSKNIDPQLIKSCGQLPHGLGLDSDHRDVFMDIDTTSILSLVSQHQSTPTPTHPIPSNNDGHNDSDCNTSLPRGGEL